MKHETFEQTGDTADLIRLLNLSPLKSATRVATIKSVRAIREAITSDGELPIVALSDVVAAPSETLRAAIGDRWIQIRSDAKRALRLWDELPLRWFALHLRGTVPTLADAVTAGSLRLGADEAKRATSAIAALAASCDGAEPDDMSATLATIEPILRAASPETFGVETLKALENKRTLVRKVVRLVDPMARGGREADVAALPAVWRTAVSIVAGHLKEHEQSALAITRRFAAFANLANVAPADIQGDLVEAFYARELATHSDTYAEKLRAFARRWNEATETGLAAPKLVPPMQQQIRQRTVTWSSVPDAIREPLDALLEQAVSVRDPGNWSDLVPDTDPDYELVSDCFDKFESTQEDGSRVIEPGTRRNWRDAVKRAWSAAMDSPRVETKPETLEDLFAHPVLTATVAAARGARREKADANGMSFDPRQKGSYEHSQIEALCSVGRALGIDPVILAPAEELKRNIDPLVVGRKRASDGTLKRVYAERRIGPRHAGKLAAFAEESRLKRWFEGPPTLWNIACQPIRLGRQPQAVHVAIARSALIARIAQYVAPFRRTNIARLRNGGDDPHLNLPVGNGPGTLRIPAIEGKTLKEIHVEIDPETVRMIRYYIQHFLPVAQKLAKACKCNPHLFPGADGSEVADGGYAPGFGFITKTKLNNTFRKHMRKYCGLDLNLHVMRHLAGKILLDQDPSAMELVKVILGHKSIKTTQAYYAEVCALVAQRRYVHLLEKSSRRVLAQVRFKFVDPPEAQKKGMAT